MDYLRWLSRYAWSTYVLRRHIFGSALIFWYESKQPARFYPGPASRRRQCIFPTNLPKKFGGIVHAINLVSILNKFLPDYQVRCPVVRIESRDCLSGEKNAISIIALISTIDSNSKILINTHSSLLTLLETGGFKIANVHIFGHVLEFSRLNMCVYQEYDTF